MQCFYHPVIRKRLNLHTIAADGSIRLQFRMHEKSVRSLRLRPPDKKGVPVEMPEGAGALEKETFTGNFAPLSQLPPPLKGKL